jgi:hypothetical protein
MKSILIILGVTLTIGLAFMFITEAVLRNADVNKSLEQTEPNNHSTQSPMDILAQSTQEVANQVRRANERDNKSRVAGAIGAGIGFISSLTIITLRDRKKSA